jgi:predicted MPP superfamily phosphohydrolase
MDPQTTRLAVLAGAAALVAGLAALALLASVLERRGVRRRSRAERLAGRLALGAGALGALCLCWALLVEPDWLEVTRHEVRTDRLPRGARVRLVHLTDLHVAGRTRALEALAGVVAAERPDLVVYTGDSLERAAGLPLFREVLGGLGAPLGRFAVRGNHDTWHWEELDLFGGGVAAELRGTSPTHVALPGGGALALCGAPYGETRGLEGCLAAARGRFRLLAYHTPDAVEALARSGDAPDLYLSGHTHGGQVRLPFYGAVITMSRFDKRYEMGRYQVGPTTLYVNRGVGGSTSRLRFLCRPEVAVVDLVGTGGEP